MYKKLFGLLLLVCSLTLFISCQQDDGKKDTDRKKSKSYLNNYRKSDSNAAMPIKKSPKGKPYPPPSTCPKDRSCPPAKKSCPNGCRKKCCVNEESKDDIAIQEMQETISVNEITSDVKMPLEDLKASLEKSDHLTTELE